MNPLLRRSFLAALVVSAGIPSAFARPIDFREVSLLVRAHQSERAITTEVSSRKLLHKLTPEQETKLKSQGASESLLQSLRNAGVVSEAEAAAVEGPREPRPSERRRGDDGGGYRDPTKNDVQVFDVAYEHPINLSYWGGPDRDFIFHRTSALDGGAQKVEMIDPNLSYTHYATYIGSAAPGFVSLEQNYSAATSHTFARTIGVDEKHPVRMPGVRYLLYPVYGVGDVALFYIGSVGSAAARVAVVRQR